MRKNITATFFSYRKILMIWTVWRSWMERSYKKQERKGLYRFTSRQTVFWPDLDESFVQWSSPTFDCEATHTRCEPSQHASLIKVYCNSNRLQLSWERSKIQRNKSHIPPCNVCSAVSYCRQRESSRLTPYSWTKDTEMLGQEDWQLSNLHIFRGDTFEERHRNSCWTTPPVVTNDERVLWKSSVYSSTGGRSDIYPQSANVSHQATGQNRLQQDRRETPEFIYLEEEERGRHF